MTDDEFWRKIETLKRQQIVAIQVGDWSLAAAASSDMLALVEQRGGDGTFDGRYAELVVKLRANIKVCTALQSTAAEDEKRTAAYDQLAGNPPTPPKRMH